VEQQARLLPRRRPGTDRPAAPVARIEDPTPAKITTNTVGNQSTSRVTRGYCELVD
jgi:hypothetical protein